MANINMAKHIWEGWTVGDFIEDLEPTLSMIMEGRSWQKKFETKEDLCNWLKDNQPYYKKRIPEVEKYFMEKYNIA